ncbi:MAG: hypothetical protein AABZ31_02150 [Bdellovibrionota bacterium]
MRDYPHLSELSQIERVEETPESVTFEFVVRHTQCEDFARTPYVMDPQRTSVYIGPAKVQLAITDETDLHVRATFNKIKVFKLNKDAADQKIERKYYFSFLPYGHAPMRQRRWDEPFVWIHPLAGMRFTGRVILTREIDGQITLKQEGQVVADSKKD